MGRRCCTKFELGSVPSPGIDRSRSNKIGKRCTESSWKESLIYGLDLNRKTVYQHTDLGRNLRLRIQVKLALAPTRDHLNVRELLDSGSMYSLI